MSTSPSQPEAPDSDELVAYLDGELSAEECRRVERRLASDQACRRRLTELEQAWSALDALPSTAVDDNFARTTIEMVAVAAAQDVQAQSATQAATGRLRAYWLATGGLAIALAAFAAARVFAPDSNRRLIAELPVIARLDGLMEVGDIEYLRSLAAIDFGSPTSDENREQTLPTADWQNIDDRRQWIESLPAGEKAEVAADFARYEQLSPENRDRLRDLDRQIAEAPDRPQLDETLGRYAAWVQQLTSGQQAELRQTTPTSKRLELARELLARTDREARRRLSAEEKKSLGDEIQRLAAERREAWIQEERRQGRPELEKRLAGRIPADVAIFFLAREMQNDEQGRQILDRLTAVLSPEARDYFQELNGWQRGLQLRRWMTEATVPKVSPQNLEQFFVDELTNDQRESLLGLPQTEMEQRLQEMYMWSKVGLRGSDMPWHTWRRDPGGRRPPGPGPGPGDRGRRGGPRGDFRDERFDGQPSPLGPGGGRPPGPPPRDGRGWRRPGGPPRLDGPPPEGGPVEDSPPPEKPI